MVQNAQDVRNSTTLSEMLEPEEAGTKRSEKKNRAVYKTCLDNEDKEMAAQEFEHCKIKFSISIVSDSVIVAMLKTKSS